MTLQLVFKSLRTAKNCLSSQTLNWAAPGSLQSRQWIHSTQSLREKRRNAEFEISEEKIDWENVPIDEISVKELALMNKQELKDTGDRWIKSLNPEKKKYLDIIRTEYDIMLNTGHQVPSSMENHMWMRICLQPAYSARKKVYKYLTTIEAKVKRYKQKKESKPKPLDPIEVRSEGNFEYRSKKNTFLRRFERVDMNKWYYNKIYHSMMYGQKLVFDMDYDEYMRPHDVTNLIDQLLACHGSNRVHPDPFYFYFCNAKPDSQSMLRFGKSTPADTFPYTYTQQSYLDIFPKDKLVYLTPNAPDMLTNYDPDDVYIIGGLVDKVVTKPVSMAKAKEEGIRMAKLPIDMHYKAVAGRKALALNQIVNILLEMKVSGDWEKALKHIPQRMVVPLSYIAEEENKRSLLRAQQMAKRAAKMRRR